MRVLLHVYRPSICTRSAEEAAIRLKLPEALSMRIGEFHDYMNSRTAVRNRKRAMFIMQHAADLVPQLLVEVKVKST